MVLHVAVVLQVFLDEATALIWKDAKYLGCGQAGGVLSCNYWPGPKASRCATPNMSACCSELVQPPTKTPGACK